MEIIAEDIPLCAFESIKENIRNEIVSGHIRKVFSLRFGYSVYNDPNYSSGKRSVYDADLLLLSPLGCLSAFISMIQKNHIATTKNRLKMIQTQPKEPQTSL